MTGQKADKLRKLSKISRRRFLTVSGATVGVVGSALLTKKAFVPSTPSYTQYPGRVANVWVSNEGADSWQNYYQKFVRLLEHNETGLDITWMQPNQRFLLNVTLDNQNRPYPYSTDPKLLYATLRYLMEERFIPASHIFIADSSRTMFLSSMGKKTTRLRAAGLSAGIDKAFSTKKRYGKFSKEKGSIQWLNTKSSIDHVLELASVTEQNNLRNIQELESSTGFFPRLTLASATRVCGEINSNSHIITHQPGMIMASNHRRSLTLLSQAYLAFSISERIAVSHMNERVVAHERRYLPLPNKGKEAVFSLDNNTNKRMIGTTIAQDGGLSLLNWYSDTVDAPVGVSRLISERYLPTLKVNELQFS